MWKKTFLGKNKKVKLLTNSGAEQQVQHQSLMPWGEVSSLLTTADYHTAQLSPEQWLQCCLVRAEELCASKQSCTRPSENSCQYANLQLVEPVLFVDGSGVSTHCVAAQTIEAILAPTEAIHSKLHLWWNHIMDESKVGSWPNSLSFSLFTANTSSTVLKHYSLRSTLFLFTV